MGMKSGIEFFLSSVCVMSQALENSIFAKTKIRVEINKAVILVLHICNKFTFLKFPTHYFEIKVYCIERFCILSIDPLRSARNQKLALDFRLIDRT